MAMPSSYEIYQRAQQSREEITEAITRSLPELSGVDSGYKKSVLLHVWSRAH